MSERAPSNPRSLAFDPVSKCLLISHFDGHLSWFDPTQRVIRADMQAGPYGLIDLKVLPHQRTCVGISSSEHAMYLIDIERPSIRRIDYFKEKPRRLLPDLTTDTIFVASLSPQHDLLYTVDGTTGAIRNRALIGRAPMTLNIDPLQHKLFVVNNMSPSLPVIDTETGSLIDTIGLPSFPTGLVMDVVGGQAFVSTTEAGVVVLRTTNGSLINHLNADHVYGASWGCLALLGGIGIDVDAQRVILGYRQNQDFQPQCAVTILDSATHAVVSRHSLPGEVMAVRVHGGKHHAYVLYQTKHGSEDTKSRVLTLQVVDTRTGSVLHEEVVGKHPLDVLFVESRNQLFIADFDEHAVVCVEDLVP